MPWILLLVMVLFSQLGVWANYFNYRSVEGRGASVSIRQQEREIACAGLQSGDTSNLPPGLTPQERQQLLAECQQQGPTLQAELDRIRSEFTLPGSIQSALTPAQLVGLILLAILTASVIGAEYGLGTLRPIIAKGTSRTDALAGKFVMLVAVTAGALIIVVFFASISSVIAGSLVDSSSGASSSEKSWADGGKAIARAWSSFIPYIALTGAVTVLTRSTAGGMALGLVYYFGEQIAIGLLSLILDWLETAGKYLPVHTIRQWAGTSEGGEPLGTAMLAVMMAIYTAVFIVFAFWLFKRRDITGPAGG